ncbi:MAG: ABC transporter permease [Bacteroidales bacterium]|nr:ABC transporter permease [Bacteroidales bacterium]
MGSKLIFPFYIGRRLSLGNDGSKSAPAVKVAIVAVALSIAVMLASIAIVGGFKREIRQKVVGFNSHLTIYADENALNETEQPLVKLTPSLRKILDELPFVTSYSLTLSTPSLLKTDNDFKGIYFKGMEYPETSFITECLEEGSSSGLPQDSGYYMVVSRKAANELNLKLNDRVDTYFISDNIKARPLHIRGIYNSHFDAYDDLLAYGSLTLVQSLSGIGTEEGSAIQIMTDDFYRIDEYESLLKQRLDIALINSEIYRPYRVESIYRQGAGYFQWLSLLDTNVLVVLILMGIVACVTLISGILILILDKVSFIGTLKALGASNAIIRRIFIYLAMKVALLGVCIGNVIMIALLWLQHKYRLIPLDPENYYIDFVPVHLAWIDFAILNAIVLLIIFVTLLVPARFVATISPSTSIRYE